MGDSHAINSKKPRPIAVATLAFLEILSGLVFLFGGMALAILGSEREPSLILYVFGALHFPIGIVFLLLGGGSWAGKGWAWVLGVALTAISIIDDIAGVTVVPLPTEGYGTLFVLIIAMVILYLLVRSEVKAFLRIHASW